MSPLLLLAALATAVGGLVLLDVVIRRTGVALGLVIAAVLVDTLGVPIQATLGPFQVYASDVVYGLLGAAAVGRLTRLPRSQPMQWVLLVFLAVTAFAVTQGAPSHGLGAAVNEARKYIHFASAALYFSTVVPDDEVRDSLARAWLLLASVLGIIAVLRWGAFFTGIGGDILGRSDTLRVLDSFDTLIVLGAALIGLGARLPQLRSAGWHPGWRRLPALTGAFLLLVVLLQHRTLWIALVVGVVAVLLRRPQAARSVVPALVGGALVVTALLTVAPDTGGQTVVVEDLSRSATDVGTFDWRVEGWKKLVERDAPGDATEWLTGQPFGAGFERYIGGRYVDVSPHNFFLESFLRVGIVGLLAFVAIHVVSISRLYRSSGSSPLLADTTLGAILVAQLIYYATSHPSAEQGVILGLAVSVATRLRSAFDPVPVPGAAVPSVRGEPT